MRIDRRQSQFVALNGRKPVVVRDIFGDELPDLFRKYLHHAAAFVFHG
jgi:hypothetical protein